MKKRNSHSLVKTIRVILFSMYSKKKRSNELTREKFSGGDCGKATPVPIPNTAVKLLSAENTEVATLWKDR